MTQSAIAVRLINALEAAAQREAGENVALVSVTIDMLAPADEGAVTVSLTRKTRTLVFMAAELKTAEGVRIAAATSLHKITS